MEDDGIVYGIGVMSVFEPIGRGAMDFDVSCPPDTVEIDFGVEEIRSGIGVRLSAVNDFEDFSRSSCQSF